MFVKRTMGSVPRPVWTGDPGLGISILIDMRTPTRAHIGSLAHSLACTYIQRGTRLVSALWLPSMSMGGFECA